VKGFGRLDNKKNPDYAALDTFCHAPATKAKPIKHCRGEGIAETAV
jgi:hypothetical protein